MVPADYSLDYSLDKDSHLHILENFVTTLTMNVLYIKKDAHVDTKVTYPLLSRQKSYPTSVYEEAFSFKYFPYLLTNVDMS